MESPSPDSEIVPLKIVMTITVLFFSNATSYMAVIPITTAFGSIIRRIVLRIFFIGDFCLSLFSLLTFRFGKYNNTIGRPELLHFSLIAFVMWSMTKICICTIIALYSSCCCKKVFHAIGLCFCYCCRRKRAYYDEECSWQHHDFPWMTSVEVFSNNNVHEEEVEDTVPVFAASAPPIAPVIVEPTPDDTDSPPEYEESCAPPSYSVAILLTK